MSIFVLGCEKPIGGETDEHGCMLMAGYAWCESKQKCLRDWEEECPAPPPEEDYGLTPEECEAKGGRAVNIVGGDACDEDETNIGVVKGFISPNICCIPGRVRLTQEQAIEIAQNSECTEKGTLTDNIMYNEVTQTWWIDLDMKEEFKKDYCNPACVAIEKTKTAEINWRCTGALPPINSFEDCINAGNPAMESYPRQCRAAGKTFVEEI